MRKVCSLLLVIALLGTCFALAGCGASQTAAPASEPAATEEETPLTMYVGLGNGGGNYYADLHEEILKATGIDVQYVYTSTVDTSTAVVEMLRQGDPPADIIITASYTSFDVQQQSLLDLAAYTSITDLFTSSKLQSLSEDGRVFQLPFCTKLIGFEYNKTLMEEMGWSVPRTYEDMVELKGKADEAGIPFAVSGGFATGHGFNYLFHLMGADYLCGPEGTEWFEQFQAGNTSVDTFAEECDYFQKYVTSGLFGKLYDSGWESGKEFCRTRALFYYNITNDVSSYDGFQYDSDGKIVGASYNADGTLVCEADDNGNAVLKDDEYLYYDESDESLKDLPRYTIPGAKVLHDCYASIPWISENGSSNCYTTYDNLVIGLRKELGEAENAQKLQQAVKVLEFMTTSTATNLFLDSNLDGYVSVKSFEPRSSLLYVDSFDSVSQGYLMPWYYNNFDIASIMSVGELVNSYIKNPSSVEFSEIIKTLDQTNQDNLNQVKEIAAHIDETLDIPQTATLECISNAKIMQKAIDDAGLTAEVTVSMLPYTNSIQDLPYTKNSMAVVQSKVYEGDFEKSSIRTLIGAKMNVVSALTLTGSEIKDIAAKGYTVIDSDGNSVSFPMRMLVKGGGTISDTDTYVVAVCPECLDSDLYASLQSEGRILSGTDGELKPSCEDGIALFFEENPQVSKDILVWN